VSLNIPKFDLCFIIECDDLWVVLESNKLFEESSASVFMVEETKIYCP
jgi:hypothetical protein